MRRFAAVVGLVILVAVAGSMLGRSAPPQADGRLKGAYRKPANNGWTYVHLQGTPAEVGYQHGYLLASEIADSLQAIRVESDHDNGRDWGFFRDAAQKMM